MAKPQKMQRGRAYTIALNGLYLGKLTESIPPVDIVIPFILNFSYRLISCHTFQNQAFRHFRML